MLTNAEIEQDNLQSEIEQSIATWPCVVCGHQVDTATSGRRPLGKTWAYFCQGKHTTKEIDQAIVS